MQNCHDPLQAALENARQQEQARQMQLMALQMAASNPHTIERIEVSGVGLTQEDDGTLRLMVATLDGRRRDVKLGPDTARVLHRQLAEVLKPAEAA